MLELPEAVFERLSFIAIEGSCPLRIARFQCFSASSRATGNPNADGKERFFSIIGKKLANASCDQRGGGSARLGKHQSKLIPTLPRRSVHGSAAVSQDLRQPAKRPVTHQMPKSIVDRLLIRPDPATEERIPSRCVLCGISPPAKPRKAGDDLPNR